MKGLFVHSPNAGTEPEPLPPLLMQLKDAGFDIRYCEHGKDDIARAIRGMEIVFAAGGDGTVTSVATELPDRNIPIVILPMGGSNNIARALGIRLSAAEVTAQLAQVQEKQLTVGLVSGPFGQRSFLEAVGVGALTQSFELVDEAPDTPAEKRENGREAFRQTLEQGRTIDCAVEIDGEGFAGPWLLVEILNIGAIGPRLPFAPRADTQDALLDIVLVKECDRAAMIKWARHFSGPPPARIVTGRKIRLHGKGLCPRVDDQPIDMPLENWTIEVEVEDEPVIVLVPRCRVGDVDDLR